MQLTLFFANYGFARNISLVLKQSLITRNVDEILPPPPPPND